MKHYRIKEIRDNTTGKLTFLAQGRFLWILWWYTFEYGEWGIAEFDTYQEAFEWLPKEPPPGKPQKTVMFHYPDLTVRETKRSPI